MARRRTFPCGHQGKGQYCHRCEQDARLRQQQDAKRDARQQQRKALENACGAPLNGIPDHIVQKALRVLQSLQEGAEVAIRRMEFDRRCVSVNLTRDYRLLLRDEGGLRPARVVTHEEYNAMIRNAALKGW